MARMAENRRLFEEVAAGTARATGAVVPGDAARRRERNRRRIAGWLAVLIALVMAMITVGGLTRLTDSGLSITEWRPVTGIVPPLSEADWAEAFAKYRTIPEASLVNPTMTIEAFRTIYWWEWAHRLLGRLIGLVWAAGFFWILLRGMMPPGWTLRLALPGMLGAVQGGIGWWMVSSGLTGTMVDVAPYRLATHLGLAFAILGTLLWPMMQLGREAPALIQARRRSVPAMRRWGGVLVGWAFVQVLLGALVAGLDAGRAYVDWPLMGGQILPDEAFTLDPMWRNLIGNEALTQFDHRVWGYLLLVLAALAALFARRSALSGVRRAFALVFAMVLAQAGLGVATVMNAAPFWLSLFHQFGAIVVFALVLRARFEACYPEEQRLRA
jgi:heme a synthase